MKKVHFIGIGGTGISAIAKVLLERGYQVSGSDVSASRYFNEITQLGGRTILGHTPELATQADLVIRSSAIRDNDPEVLAARSAGKQVLKRSEFLKELTNGQSTLAIAGSHGKTTTTAMLAWLLTYFKQDPSFIVGAIVKSLGTNARSGTGEYFVIEADEYDNMFLGLNPRISVITNVEHDHPDCFPDLESYTDAFKKFLKRTDESGAAIVCGDDPGISRLSNDFNGFLFPVFTYGFSNNCDYQITRYQWSKNAYTFTVSFKKQAISEFSNIILSLPGKHNILNATAALAVIHQLGLPVEDLTQGLQLFKGTERRFDILIEKDGIVIIDDYGHHPTQIMATLMAVRELYPDKQLWAVWEPHTFSRTEQMQKEFVRALAIADKVLVTKIYAAREDDDGFTPKTIAQSLSEKSCLYLPNNFELAQHLVSNVTGNDVIVVLSAGYGPQISKLVMESLWVIPEVNHLEDEHA